MQAAKAGSALTETSMSVSATTTRQGRRTISGNPKMLGKIKNKLSNFLRNEDGPTAVEYAIMLAAILLVCIGAIGTLGGVTQTMFNDIQTDVNNLPSN